MGDTIFEGEGGSVVDTGLLAASPELLDDPAGPPPERAEVVAADELRLRPRVRQRVDTAQLAVAKPHLKRDCTRKEVGKSANFRSDENDWTAPQFGRLLHAGTRAVSLRVRRNQLHLFLYQIMRTRLRL